MDCFLTGERRASAGAEWLNRRIGSRPGENLTAGEELHTMLAIFPLATGDISVGISGRPVPSATIHCGPAFARCQFAPTRRMKWQHHVMSRKRLGIDLSSFARTRMRRRTSDSDRGGGVLLSAWRSQPGIGLACDIGGGLIYRGLTGRMPLKNLLCYGSMEGDASQSPSFQIAITIAKHRRSRRTKSRKRRWKNPFPASDPPSHSVTDELGVPIPTASCHAGEANGGHYHK